MGFRETPLRRIELPNTDMGVWVKDESVNLTGTFKDRLAWALTRQVSGRQDSKLLISCITLGNTVQSIGRFFKDAFAERDRPQVLGLFPSGFSKRQIGPDSGGRKVSGGEILRHCEDLGVTCIETDLESSYLSVEDIRGVAIHAGLDFNTHRDVSYGIGEDAYSVILKEALDEIGTPPDIVLVPVGAGVLFDECVRLVEERGLPTRVLGISVVKKESVADKIYGYYSPYFRSLQQGNIACHAKHPRHLVVVVEDCEILVSVEALATCHVNAEPSAAATFAPLFSQSLEGAKFTGKEKVLVINTGNGMVPS